MPLGITKGIQYWNSQKQTVERFTDNASYSSGHPDDTLLLAGPPRLVDAAGSGNQGFGQTSGPMTVLAVGMVQGFQFSSTKPSQMLQSIGSGRGFFVSGKSSTTWQIGRLFANGRNLLRVLYHTAVANDLPVQNFDDPAAATSNKDIYWVNLDSELFYIPLGLAAIFRDKAGDLIGSVYLELCMIQSYAVGFNAGQGMIMENVNGACDRVLPFLPSAVAANPSVPRATIDKVIGFLNGDNTPTLGTGLGDDNLAKTDNV